MACIMFLLDCGWRGAGAPYSCLCLGGVLWLLVLWYLCRVVDGEELALLTLILPPCVGQFELESALPAASWCAQLKC